MRKRSAPERIPAFLSLALILTLIPFPARAQGFNVPAKHWGLSFGNSVRFTGIRLNLADRDLDKITGINICAWGNKESERQTGSVNGISIGLPAAFSCANRNGINLGIAAVGAAKNLRGINLGVLAAGAGNNVAGINLGLLGVGAGNDLIGLNIGGLGTGAGGNMSGINFGGLGAGAGGDVKGITVGLLGAGAGGDLGGINIGGLGVGAGGNVWGLSLGGLGMGGGGKVTGINLGGIGVGAGEHLRGISIAGIGIGAPKVTGIQCALVAGGNEVRGITIAPAYFRIEAEEGASMKGISVSAFNHIQGEQFGIAIGIFNYAYAVHGFQLGVLNHVKNNPRGLRWLPLFNTSF